MPNGHTFSTELEISGYRDEGFLCGARQEDERLFALQSLVVDLTIAAFLP
jgi:hypothetical protein